MREAARGGGLFSNRRAARGSGDGEAAQLAPIVTAAPIKRNSALGDHPLSLGIGRIPRDIWPALRKRPAVRLRLF
jgi:hypothetical protein